MIFRWKDYADNNSKKTMELDGVEFLRRFLMHVLPNGFMRIRHFGFLANCIRQARIDLIRQLLALTGQLLQKSQTAKKQKSKSSDTSCICPVCHKKTLQSRQSLFSPKRRQSLVRELERIKP